MAEEAGSGRRPSYDVIVAPHITEKATLLSENNAVVFRSPGRFEPEIKCGGSALGRSGEGREHDRPEGQDEELARPAYTRTDVKKAIVTLAETSRST